MFDVPLLVQDRDRAAADNQFFDRINPVTTNREPRCGRYHGDARPRRPRRREPFRLGPAAARLDAGPASASRRPSRIARRCHFAAITDEIGATPSLGCLNVELGAAMLRDAAALTTRSRARSSPPTSPA